MNFNIVKNIKAEHNISSRCKIRIQTHTINSMLSDRVQCNNSRLRTAPCEKQKTRIMFQNITTAQSKKLAHIAAHLSADVTHCGINTWSLWKGAFMSLVWVTVVDDGGVHEPSTVRWKRNA